MGEYMPDPGYMNRVERVLITARGEPTDRATWSGTPLSLAQAFENQDIQVETLSLARDSMQSRLVSAIPGVLRYERSDRAFFSFLWPRYHSARRAMARWRRLNPDVPVIHTDTMWLPYDGIGGNDFLYRDVTWRTLAEGWSVSERLAQDLEKRHRGVYQQVGGIFTTAKWVRDELIDRYIVDPARVVSVGTGVGLIEPFKGKKDYSTGNTLFVAKVRFEQKGGPLLLEAFSRAREVDSRLTLTLIAPSGVSSLREGVTVLSGISWKDLQDAYRRAALFAMPATWEPWGMVYIEALLNRVPVLGLDEYAFPELSGDGEYGFIVEEYTVDAIAAALLEAHSNPDRLAAMGQVGQRHAVTTYSWARTAALILDHMQDVPTAATGAS